jgi:hypothetical protein
MHADSTKLTLSDSKSRDVLPQNKQHFFKTLEFVSINHICQYIYVKVIQLNHNYVAVNKI